MQNEQNPVRTGKGADIAFAVVVLASYFSVFSSLQSYSSIQIFLLVVLGMSYIGFGIYGYSFCIHSQHFFIKALYFLFQIVQGGVIVYLGKGAGFNAMVLLPLTGHSVIMLSQMYQYLANFLILLAYIIAIFLVTPSLEAVLVGLPTFLAGQIFIIVFTQMALTEEKNRMEVERLVHDLSKANQRLRHLLIQVEELATEKERNRLAREIHDGLGHYLTAIHVQLEAAIATIQTDLRKTEDLILSARKVTQDALVEVRKSVAALRNPIDDNVPIEEQIQKLLVNATSMGIRSTVEIVGDSRPIDPKVLLTLFRIVQEGVNNICKHSKASEVKIVLKYLPNQIINLEIMDNGVGSDHFDGGFGLIGLKERIQFVNGSIQFWSESGKGFKISALIPG